MTKDNVISWLPLALLGAALVALFYPLATGQALFWGLPALQFYPWRHLAFEQIGHGHLPAWNPLVGAGAPLLANYQIAVFYPPNWFYALLPDPQAMSVIALLHIVWAGVGMWLFAGALGMSQFGRGISTLAYALGGYLIARLGSFPTANAGAWLPWLFWLVYRIATGRRWRDVGGLALVFGLLLLVGHAQTTWYGALSMGLYALWIILWSQRRDPWRPRLMTLAQLGLGVLLGVVIAAVQLVPTAEYLLESQRSGGLDFETTANLSYNPFRLVTLLNPNFYGTPADGSYITKGIFFEDTAYIGFIPFVAAIAAIAAWMRHRHALNDHPTLRTVPFWALLAVGALVIAMGRYAPVFRILYDTVPTFDAFREPVRWLILTVLALSILAGFGVDYWGRGKWVVFWSRLSAAGGGAMVIMALAYLEFGASDQEELEVLSHGMIVLGCWVVVAALLTLVQPGKTLPGSPVLWRTAVLIVVTVDLGWAAIGLNPTVPLDFYDPAEIERPVGRTFWFADYEEEIKFERFFDLADYRTAHDNWHAVRVSMLPNLNMLDEVPSLTNDDPFLPEVHSRYVDLIEDLGVDAGALLHAAGVSRVYGVQPDGWTGADGVYESPAESIPAAWIVPEAVWINEDDALEAALRNPGWNPAQTVFLAGEGDTSPSSTPELASSVELAEDTPTERRYRVTVDGAAYLVISTTWYPGWSAQINGEDADLLRANLAFQTVAVPPGESEVTLRYDLTGWPESALVSLLAALVAGSLIVVGTWHARKNTPSDG